MKQGVNIPRKDAHKFVGDSFSDSENRKEQNIGRKLFRLKQARIKADYDDSISGIAKLSEESLKLSREILTALAKLK